MKKNGMEYDFLKEIRGGLILLDLELIFDIYNSQEISRRYNIHLRSFVRDIHSYFIALRSIPPRIRLNRGTRVSTRVRKYADTRT